MPRVATRWDVAAMAIAKATLSLGVLATGFVALSDDDYSRTVIAEQFARSPSLDPSGTSWLPLPFWIHGAAMAIFGRSLATAQATAVVLGVLSAICIHRAALWLGLSRPAALAGAFVATSIPTAARLGVCTQPEALTAGLVVLGAAATTMDGSRRLAGAVALFAACLCRYEAWAAAAAFAAVALYDGARGRRPSGNEALHPGVPRSAVNRPVTTSCATIAVLGPVLWIAHGVASHGDALFFLHRVAAYRRALGATEPLAHSLLAYPAALVLAEPEVTFSAILLGAITASLGSRSLRAFSRPALVVGAVFVFLVAGRVLDGAPTHHAERTLLPLWTLLSLFVANAFAFLLAARAGAPSRVVALVLGLAVVSVLWRSFARTERGAPRDAERAIGILSRRHLKDDERLLVDTSDYGYFAVIAAFGAPERADVVARHDPRQPSVVDPLATRASAASLLKQSNASWLVVETPHAAVASSLGSVVASAGGFSLLRVSSLR